MRLYLLFKISLTTSTHIFELPLLQSRDDVQRSTKELKQVQLKMKSAVKPNPICMRAGITRIATEELQQLQQKVAPHTDQIANKAQSFPEWQRRNYTRYKVQTSPTTSSRPPPARPCARWGRGSDQTRTRLHLSKCTAHVALPHNCGGGGAATLQSQWEKSGWR